MVEVMGGTDSPLFDEFITLFVCGFFALQVESFTSIYQYSSGMTPNIPSLRTLLDGCVGESGAYHNID